MFYRMTFKKLMSSDMVPQRRLIKGSRHPVTSLVSTFHSRKRSTRTDRGPSFTNIALCVDVEDGIRNTRNWIDTVVNEGSSAEEFVVIHPTATALSENSPIVVIQISGNREDVDHT